MSWWHNQRHSGEYGGKTVIPPAWPQIDEEVIAEVASTFEALASNLRSDVVPGLQRQMMAMSDAWDGAGSEAACAEASAIIDKHEADAVVSDEIARKFRAMESSVIKTKIAVNSIAEQVQKDCEVIASDESLSWESRVALMDGRIADGLAENVAVVSTNTAELAGNVGFAARSAELDVSTRNEMTPPSTSDRTRHTLDEAFRPASFAPSITGSERSSVVAGLPRGSEAADSEYSGIPAATPQAQPPPGTQPPPPTAAPSPITGSSSAPSSSNLGSGVGTSPLTTPPSGSASGSSSSAGKLPSVAPSSDGAAAGAGRSSGAGNPTHPGLPLPAPLAAPAPATQPAQAVLPVDAPTASTPAAAGLSGGGFSGAAPTPTAGPTPMPLGPPTTPTPPAPVSAGHPAPTSTSVAGSASTSATAASPSPVPVSAARAERDAIAAAAAAGALRRRNRGNDPTQLARRVAAALSVEMCDFGFYWATAITTDDSIVVANSYGIGYIPAKVLLPEQIKMATADESIPAAERARWATYPILALQGWALHHQKRLRLLIATEGQLQGCDPGVPTSILQPDDLPESGMMQGRTRLEVLAPGLAAKLAATRDKGLIDLLPPAQAGPDPAPHDLAMAWFEVSKPLMSGSTDRARVHLKAMAAYSVQAMESAHRQARSEAELGAQRAAVADWLYWQHQYGILSEVLENPWRERG